jgi:Tol biopolymer transport system component
MHRSWSLLALTLGTGLTVGCSASTPAEPAVGTLEVTTSTAGEDMGSGGYSISVDGAMGPAIGVNETVTISEIAAGDREVELKGVPSNCAVTGENPRTVNVTAGARTATGFDITCESIVPPPPLVGRIAFQSSRDGNAEIYLMNADGSGQTRLTTDPAFDGTPAISPDGTRILFESQRDETPMMDIYVMNLDGTGQVNLTNHPAWDERPRWSPNGTRILFSSNRDGPVDIFVMNADGSDPVNLTSNAGRDRPADWSPEGTRIAFSSDRTGAFEIYTMNADGSDLVPLTNNPDAADFAPAWSPDGTRIAYVSNPSPGNPYRGDIFVMNADGSDPVNLTNNPDLNSRWPSWSPDGTLIAFSTSRTGNFEVFVMNADGSGPINVSNSPESNDLAGWPQAWRRD